MLFDIGKQVFASNWLHEVLGTSCKDPMQEFIINHKKNVDSFIDEYLDKIKSIDIDSTEFVFYHSTTNSNQCAEIKQNGLLSLKEALSGPSELNLFLDSQGIKFNTDDKTMNIEGVEYNIDYDIYKGIRNLSSDDEKLKEVARRIYSDYAVNGFFAIRDLFNYSSPICKEPEFLTTLSCFNSKTAFLRKKWRQDRNSYIVKFKVKLNQLAVYTFYKSNEDYRNDINNGLLQLKKRMVGQAIQYSALNLTNGEIGYMNPKIKILPEQIVECCQI